MKNIKLKCATGGFKFGDIAPVGKGGIDSKVATQLVKDKLAIEVKDAVSTNSNAEVIELKGQLNEMTEQLATANAKVVALNAKEVELNANLDEANRESAELKGQLTEMTEQLTEAKANQKKKK